MSNETGCCVCLELWQDTFLVLGCSGILCQNCFQKTIQKGTGCPWCKRECTQAQSSKNPHVMDGLARSLIIDHRKLLPVQCPHEWCTFSCALRDMSKHVASCMSICESCGQQMATSHMNTHLETECLVRLMTCDFCGDDRVIACMWQTHIDVECGAMEVSCPHICKFPLMPRRDLLEHMSQDCPRTRLDCEDCEQKVYREELKWHKTNMCPMRLETCCFCHATMLHRNLEKHKTSDCLEIEVKCSQCEEKIVRKSLKMHVRDTCLFTSIQCDKCQQPMLRRFYSNHQEKQCRFRQGVCSFCKLLVFENEIRNHISICPQKHVKCGACCKAMRRKYLASHLRLHCSERQVHCRQNPNCHHYWPHSESAEKMQHTCPTTATEFAEKYCKPPIGMTLDIYVHGLWQTVLVTDAYLMETCWALDLLRYVDKNHIEAREFQSRTDDAWLVAPAHSMNRAFKNLQIKLTTLQLLPRSFCATFLQDRIENDKYQEAKKRSNDCKQPFFCVGSLDALTRMITPLWTHVLFSANKAEDKFYVGGCDEPRASNDIGQPPIARWEEQKHAQNNTDRIAVVCAVQQTFEDYVVVEFQNMAYFVARNSDNLISFNLRDLVPHQLYCMKIMPRAEVRNVQYLKTNFIRGSVTKKWEAFVEYHIVETYADISQQKPPLTIAFDIVQLFPFNFLAKTTTP